MTLVVLPNFPFKNQLTEATADGKPPENARFDCVAVSFAAAIQYYDGGYVSGDELKDAEYGDTYANAGTALRRYVDDATDLARAKYHCTAVPYTNTNPASLVGRIHTWLQQGYPVIATIPSDWSNFGYSAAARAKPSFSTHVIVFYGEIDGGLEAMNPWKAFKHLNSDANWAKLLCFAQVWAVTREEVMLDIAHSLGYFKQKTAGSDAAWVSTHNNLEVNGALLPFYRSYGGNALNGLTYLGLPVTGRISPIAGYSGSIQVFERGILADDAQHKFDAPPGAGPVYLMHIEQGPGNTWLLSAVRAQLVQAQANDVADKASIKSLTDEVNNLKANPPAPTLAQAVKAITDQLHADGKL